MTELVGNSLKPPRSSAALEEVTELKSYNRELLRVASSWLADLFPDELIIQEKTVSLIRNTLLTSETEIMPVRDIGRVVLTKGLIFSDIRILGKNPAHEIFIRGLPKQLARKTQDIIEGLILEDKGAVDVPDHLHLDTRRQMLEDAGKNI